MAGKARKIGTVCLGIVAFAIGGFYFSAGGRDVRNLWKNGSIEDVIKPPEKVEYSANNEANLKALQTALVLYHDSEGQFPKAEGWMDAIKNRLTSNDLKEGEGEKKLHDPSAGSGPDVYGYAMNDGAASKYIKDLKDPAAPILFESKSTVKNAHGDPAKDGKPGGKGITADGKIITLK